MAQKFIDVTASQFNTATYGTPKTIGINIDEIAYVTTTTGGNTLIQKSNSGTETLDQLVVSESLLDILNLADAADVSNGLTSYKLIQKDSLKQNVPYPTILLNQSKIAHQVAATINGVSGTYIHYNQHENKPIVVLFVEATIISGAGVEVGV
jgi:hypothetical protein